METLRRGQLYSSLVGRRIDEGSYARLPQTVTVPYAGLCSFEDRIDVASSIKSKMARRQVVVSFASTDGKAETQVTSLQFDLITAG